MNPDTEISVAAANRLAYERIAQCYDATEECVIDPRLRRRLEQRLRLALSLLQSTGPSVLDACGGSGNASLMLLSMGIQPVTVDVSPDMLGLYAQKARTLGLAPTCVAGEIGDFLATHSRLWDLIVFSSALHHLDDYESVAELAFSRLAVGGVLLTVFDPTEVGRLGRATRRLDYMIHVVIRTPQALPRLLKERASPRRQPAADHQRNIGILAERHALTGVDDAAIAQRLRAAGGEIVRHERFYEGRFAVTRALFRATRQPSSFSLMVRRHS